MFDTFGYQFKDYDMLISGGKYISVKFRESIRKVPSFCFYDSFALLSMQLAKLPKIFGFENESKEISPYLYYTQEHIDNYINGQDTSIKDLDISVKYFKSKEDHDEFLKQDMGLIESYIHYCQQDVNILSKAFKALAKLSIKMTGSCFLNYCIISSAVYVYMKHKISEPGPAHTPIECSHYGKSKKQSIEAYKFIKFLETN